MALNRDAAAEFAAGLLEIAEQLRAATAPVDEVAGKAACHAEGCELPEHVVEDFTAELDGKAVVESVFEGGQEKGLIIRGTAADWTVDRENEAFEPGAFDEGIKAFMRNPVIAFFHSTDVAETVKGPTKYVQLGKVTRLEKNAAKSKLEFEGFLPRPQHGGFLANVYEQVKSGVMRGVSVGGRFFKHRTPTGWKIFKADLQELTIAPKGVNTNALIESVEMAKAQGGTPLDSLDAVVEGNLDTSSVS